MGWDVNASVAMVNISIRAPVNYSNQLFPEPKRFRIQCFLKPAFEEAQRLNKRGTEADNEGVGENHQGRFPSRGKNITSRYAKLEGGGVHHYRHTSYVLRLRNGIELTQSGHK